MAQFSFHKGWRHVLESGWIYLGGLLGPIVGAVAFVLITQPWRARSTASVTIAWPVALACGLATGVLLHLAGKRVLPWPPSDALQWTVMAVLPAVTLVEVLGAIPRFPRWVAWGLRVGAYAAIPAVLLQSYIEHQWTREQAIAWLAGLGATAVLGRVVLHLIVKPAELSRGAWDGRVAWIALVIASGMAGVTVMSSGSVIGGQLGLSVGVTLGAVWLASLFCRDSGIVSAGAGVAWAMLACVLINGRFFAELSVSHAVLLTLAPFAMVVTRLPWIRHRKAWVTGLIVAVLATAIAGSAAIPAMRAAMAATSEEDDPGALYR